MVSEQTVNNVKTVANIALGTGTGIALGQVVGGVTGTYLTPNLPVVGNIPAVRVGINVVAKLAVGAALLKASRRGQSKAHKFAEYASYGVLGTAFSEIVFAVLSSLVRVPGVTVPAGYGGYAFTPNPGGPAAVARPYRPSAHMTAARPSVGRVPSVGTSIGPKTKGGRRPVNVSRPHMVAVSQ